MPVAEDMLGLESALGEPQGPQLYNPTKRSNVSGEGGLAEITLESSWKEPRQFWLSLVTQEACGCHLLSVEASSWDSRCSGDRRTRTHPSQGPMHGWGSCRGEVSLLHLPWSLRGLPPAKCEH